jgi:hypothetical protein
MLRVSLVFGSKKILIVYLVASKIPLYSSEPIRANVV